MAEKKVEVKKLKAQVIRTTEDPDLPVAGCVLLLDPNFPNTTLVIERRDEHLNYGLPAGKLESGETTIQTALRELEEETSIVFTEDDLLDLRFISTVKEDFNPKARRYLTATYIGLAEFESLAYGDGEHPVSFINFDTLTSPRYSSFYHYNARLISFCEEMGLFAELGWQ